MCGIIGILGETPVVPRLLEALHRLEYRGYDSAGIAVHAENGQLIRRRAAGKLANLRTALQAEPVSATSGMGHTRWATHGPPTQQNAHPHKADGVMVVHNGIIENFRQLRTELEAKGHKCETDTDTETIAKLIAVERQEGTSPKEAVHRVLKRLDGAFAIVVMFAGEEDLLIGARKGSPLVIGIGEREMYLGSDAIALAPFTPRIVYLEEGDWCALTHHSYEVFGSDGTPQTRPETLMTMAVTTVDKGNYRHFMQKEIYDQAEASARTLGHYIDADKARVAFPQLSRRDLQEVTQIQIIACGTSFYTGMVAQYWLEQIARLPVKTDIASEFRYRDPQFAPNTLAIFISQSGETADTLAALRYCRAAGLKTAGLVNVTTSSIAREVDFVIPIFAGPEIGVASTKAFTSFLCALACFTLYLAKARGKLTQDQESSYIEALEGLPRLINQVLTLIPEFERLARDLVKARDILYLGRGVHYPIALEGALKLKEISYIHAEGYAAGELKHGPIALIDEETPVIFVAPEDALFDKSLSNLQEVAARRGAVILLSNAKGIEKAGDAPAHSVEIPDCPDFIAPILYAVPVQLLAYHIAVEKGTDVDQPRNLAKSVTVE